MSCADIHQGVQAHKGRRFTARTLAYRARFSSDMRQAHKHLDDLIAEILVLERDWDLLRALLPDGALAHNRKDWSYRGRLKDGRDIGNWYYAVVMRLLFDSGLTDYDHCNDETLGDVLEAIFHLGYNAAPEYPVSEYARLLDAAVLRVDRITDTAKKLGYWLTSREMAGLLL